VDTAKEQKAANSSLTTEEVKKMCADEQNKTKTDLELEKIRLENDKIRLEIRSFGKPSKWEIIKYFATFFGVIVPAMIAITTFLYQRQTELRMEKIRAFERARLMIQKGDIEVGILQLSLLGKEAIPHLLNEIKLDEYYSEWPLPPLAAVAGLKRIGIENLTEIDKKVLHTKVNIALDLIDIDKNNGVKRELKHYRIERRIAIIKEIISIIGTNPQWDSRISQAKQFCDQLKSEFR
jgi:hypothetical protein